jgi:hypothetical protein
MNRLREKITPRHIGASMIDKEIAAGYLPRNKPVG